MLITNGTADEKENARDHDNHDHDSNSNEQQTESHFERPAAEVNRGDCCFSFRSDAMREFSGARDYRNAAARAADRGGPVSNKNWSSALLPVKSPPCQI
jgi:hypothetical protein